MGQLDQAQYTRQLTLRVHLLNLTPKRSVDLVLMLLVSCDPGSDCRATHRNLRTLHNTKHISIQRPIEVVHWRFAPSSRVETPLGPDSQSWFYPRSTRIAHPEGIGAFSPLIRKLG